MVFGTVKQVSIGPTSLMSLLTYEYTKDLPPQYVVLLTFMCGIVEMLMGLLKLGKHFVYYKNYLFSILLTCVIYYLVSKSFYTIRKQYYYYTGIYND